LPDFSASVFRRIDRFKRLRGSPLRAHSAADFPLFEFLPLLTQREPI
jgi:hypothetical protein